MEKSTNETVVGPTRLILLRHGEVASHRGDVPVTADGLRHAEQAGKALGAALPGPVTVLFGGTRRTRETAEAVARGLGDEKRWSGPIDAFALRNPDLYLAGTRVNMVSSAAALAEQVPEMDEAQAAEHPWWAHFFTASDRIGWWLHDPTPPGETASAVFDRIQQFARSLADRGPRQGETFVGVTHSPILRSVLFGALGHDPGEPAYVTGAQLDVERDGAIRFTPHDPFVGD